MAFILAGSTITQNNGPSNTVTSIVSDDAGVLVTVNGSHNLGTGDIVDIRGTGTPYDGVHSVVSIGGTASFVIGVEHGSDYVNPGGDTATTGPTAAEGDNMATLESITGVTSENHSISGFPYEVIDASGFRLVVNGGVLHNQFTTSVFIQTVQIRAGGHMVIGVSRTMNGFEAQANLPALYCVFRGTNPQNDPGIDVQNGGELDIIGSQIIMHSALAVQYTSSGSRGTLRCTNASVFMEGAATSNGVAYKLRLNSDDVYIDGLRLFGGSLTVQREPVVLENFEPTHGDGIQVPGAANRQAFFTFRNYLGGGRGSSQDCRTTNTKFRFTNSRTGSDLVLRAHNPNSSGSAEVVKEALLAPVDAAGDRLGGVTFYSRDTDHGNRANYTQQGNSDNYVDDRVYRGTLPADTSVSHVEAVLTSVYVDNGTNRDGAIRDNRGKNDDSTDLFDWYFVSYDKQLTEVPNQAMRGTGRLTIAPLLPDDQFINETDRSSVAAYTGISFDRTDQTITISENHSLDELYDYMKYTKTIPANADYPTPATLIVTASSASTLTTGMQIVVDAGATLSEGEKFKEIETTAGITLMNAGVISALFREPDGVGLRLAGLENSDIWRVSYGEVSTDGTVTQQAFIGTGPIIRTVPRDTDIDVVVRREGHFITYRRVNSGDFGASYTPVFEALPGTVADIGLFRVNASVSYVVTGEGAQREHTIRVDLSALPPLELTTAHTTAFLDWVQGEGPYMEAVIGIESGEALRVNDNNELLVHDDLRLEVRLADSITDSNYFIRFPVHIDDADDLSTPENAAGRSVIFPFINNSNQVDYDLIGRRVADVLNLNRAYDPSTSIETVTAADGTTEAFDWQDENGNPAGTGTPYRRVRRA